MTEFQFFMIAIGAIASVMALGELYYITQRDR